jgi:hypothetical protein
MVPRWSSPASRLRLPRCFRVLQFRLRLAVGRRKASCSAAQLQPSQSRLLQLRHRRGPRLLECNVHVGWVPVGCAFDRMELDEVAAGYDMRVGIE